MFGRLTIVRVAQLSIFEYKQGMAHSKHGNIRGNSAENSEIRSKPTGRGEGVLHRAV
jgi:hypothetical protein